MEWPRTPVERVQAFRPTFCPWPECSEHRREKPGFPFHHHTRYRTARRTVPRFRCLACKRTFSRQTFAASYYLKRPELLLPVAAALQAGSAHRQIARSFGCAPSTVTRLSARLGRHGLLLLARSLASLENPPYERIVVDHFETFEFSQDLPFGIATPIGHESWFVYGLDPAPHGRTGRTTPAQRERMSRRPVRRRYGSYRGSFGRVLELLEPLGKPDNPRQIVCDGMADYSRAHARHPGKTAFELRCYPNPERGPKGSPRSKEASVRDRAMFANDTFHNLVRHTAAHHRRETIAFGRRLGALMERMFLLAVWRNYIKGVSERKPDPTTPAMRLGLATEPWTWRRVLSRRLFFGRERVTKIWEELYRRKWTTPVLPENTVHDRRHAF